MSYGFIVTRHVNSEKTNRYWNHCVKCIRRFYPYRKIVVIDDNSQQEFVKADGEYRNVEFIQSEYPGRGELLPFVYFLRHHWFQKAVIVHDSVFFHKRVAFEKIGDPVIPLWHFDSIHVDNHANNMRIGGALKAPGHFVRERLHRSQDAVHSVTHRMDWKGLDRWHGCFGVQCYIDYHFLQVVETKYGITNMIGSVTCRADRCSLERIMSVIFLLEHPALLRRKSLLGDIFGYLRFGYSYEEYEADLKAGKVLRPVIKVWTGR
jgi:hypothetical protein